MVLSSAASSKVTYKWFYALVRVSILNIHTKLTELPLAELQHQSIPWYTCERIT